MANITRFGPLDDVFGDLMKGFWVKPMALEGTQSLQIRMDVKEGEKCYTVHADIPGVRKEDIHVTVDGAMVTIEAEVKKEADRKEEGKLIRSERYEGKVARSFTLPVEVDLATAEAKYQDGVLDLVLPKKTGAGSRRIAVQ
jgi:HSP20 family protein